MKTLRNILIGFILGLAVGFVPSYMNWRAARSVIDEIEPRLAISDAHSRLAILYAHTEAGDWNPAGKASTEAFDAVDGLLDTVEDPQTKRRLLTAAQSRDEITAGVAVADGKVVSDLRRLVLLLAESL